jgi:FeS assembly SUF system protein
MNDTGKIESPETAAEAPAPASLPDAGGETASLHDRVIAMLETIFDPEIPVNIYELGLVYNVEASDDGDVIVTMTLTTPNCPVAGSMPGEVETKVSTVPGVRGVTVDLVWDPPWTPERMSEAARLELGML